MRQTMWWTGNFTLVLGGWISLIGACFGGENENRDQSNRQTIAASERSAGGNQQPGRSNGEQKPQPDVDDHVRHHAALGVLTSKSEYGVSVVGVIPGSPAALAGLRVGDEIRYVGDERIRTTQGLTEEIREYQPGSQVDLSIRRNGERRIVKAKLASQESTFRDRSQTNRMVTNGNDASLESKSGRNSGAADRVEQRIRALKQQIARLQMILLQQEVDRLTAHQDTERADQEKMQSEDWGWDGRDNQGHDPSLFQ